MSSKPLVSIITPFFNTEKFLEEAIVSVLAQTYDNWELLLVDDGSTDSSTEIAQKYSRKYPDKVRYLQHEGHQNLGKSTSRNLGINNAKGEYISFLDADDIFLPLKLEKQIAILESHPEACMVYGNTLYWYSWTENRNDNELDYIPEMGLQDNTLFQPPSLLHNLLGNVNSPPCICSFVLQRQVAENIGGFEEAIQDLYEDQVFLAKIFLNVPVFFEGGCWEKYRQRDDSSWHVSLSNGEDDSARQVFLNWLEKYLLEQGFKGTEVWDALQQALWPYRHPILHKFRKMNKQKLKLLAKQTLPAPVHRWLGSQLKGNNYCPPTGMVNWGSLRRLTPISREFGYYRGVPIDRYYIENFLADNSSDIHGRILEIGDNSYTCRFGGDKVIKSDVLHVVEGNPQATFVGDLTKADHLPSNVFDCALITQTLHLIYDMRVAVATLHRILKPGGTLLVTVPGISQVVKCNWGDDWCWALTTQSARLLFEEFFPKTNVQVQAHGNVLAATAFLQGLVVEELRQEELDYQDSEYQVLITVRVVKPEVIS